MKVRSRHVIIVAAVLIPILALFALRVGQALQKKSFVDVDAHKAVPVVVARAERQLLTQTVTLSGVIRPYNEVMVVPKLAAKVERMAVNVGDTVQAGQVLLTLGQRDVRFAQAQSRAQKAAAAAAVEQASTGLNSYAVQLERLTKLRAASAVSDADYEQLQSAMQAARASYQMAQANLELATVGQTVADEMVANTIIRAPFHGTITRKLTDVGAQVTPMQPLVQIQDLHALIFVATVDVDHYSLIKIGQKAQIIAKDFPESKVNGAVRHISPTLDPYTRRASLEIEINDPPSALITNMLAEAHIATDQNQEMLTIPTSAVITSASGRSVRLVRNEHVVVVHPSFGTEFNDVVEIADGIEAGDAVIISGSADLADAARVRVVPAIPLAKESSNR